MNTTQDRNTQLDQKPELARTTIYHNQSDHDTTHHYRTKSEVDDI